ncbi:MAG: hypothetical protein V4510_10630 [bacterium]
MNDAMAQSPTGGARQLTNKRALCLVMTKDRPHRLTQALPKIAAAGVPTIVVDDSTQQSSHAKNQWTCQALGIKHHDARSQQELLANVSPDAQDFVSCLGQAGWTLGRGRNYLLLLAASVGADQLIMVDDDILPSRPSLFHELLASLASSRLAGVAITGMPDHSVVGHLFRAGGQPPPPFMSASCLALRPRDAQQAFSNYYNEDWVWIYMQNGGQRPVSVGKVTQLDYDPFAEAIPKALAQEPGEVMWNGLSSIRLPRQRAKIRSERFWAGVLEGRKRQLEVLAGLPMPEPHQAVRERVLTALRGHLNKQDPWEFSKEFESLIDSGPRWNALLTKAWMTVSHDPGGVAC